jgi:hypothetical protein
MKILKSAVIAFSLAMAMGSFSTAAVAEAGRTTYKPIDAINTVLERIAAADAAIAAGTNGDEVAALIKKGANMAEEINANDKVARESSKAAKHMKAAIAAAKAGNLAESKEHLSTSKQIVESLKSLL